MQDTVNCKTLSVDDNKEYSRNFSIPESEGECAVTGPLLGTMDVPKPLKLKKVNIGTEEQPKLAKIGDYQDADIMGNIVELLIEYQDLFPTKSSELKGNVGELGVIRITLKPDARPVTQRPYWLNPKYKRKVKDELDKMVAVGIIESVEEFEWVSPMVVQEKKTKGEIRICVDPHKLNDACIYDPFPTLFLDEILDNVGGQEAYSFIDGFSGYHQIRIAPEDRSKTNFAIEWGSFQYTIMPFGLKNSPTILSHVVIALFKEFIHKFLEVYFDDWILF